MGGDERTTGQTVLSLHDYNGAGNGSFGDPNRAHIAQVQALAHQLGISGVLISETGGRPSHPYCEAVQDAVARGVGYFLWALMIGADQFGPPLSAASPPFQGLVYPNGTWYDMFEELPCIRDPASVILVPDTAATELKYSPADAWALWTLPGSSVTSCVRTYGPRRCTLHYTRQKHATVTLSVQISVSPRVSIYLYYKRGADCGIFDAYINNETRPLVTVDSYAPALESNGAAEWNA